MHKIKIIVGLSISAVALSIYVVNTLYYAPSIDPHGTQLIVLETCGFTYNIGRFYPMATWSMYNGCPMAVDPRHFLYRCQPTKGLGCYFDEDALQAALGYRVPDENEHAIAELSPKERDQRYCSESGADCRNGPGRFQGRAKQADEWWEQMKSDLKLRTSLGKKLNIVSWNKPVPSVW